MKTKKLLKKFYSSLIKKKSKTIDRLYKKLIKKSLHGKKTHAID